MGAAMHRAGYAALGLDYAYVPFRCTDLPGALSGMRALGIRGFGISMPFKEQILPLLDDLHPMARRIGAVNTVVNEGDRLVGHNTDALGAVRALEELTELDGTRVLVLGAGGAARAVIQGLLDAGARVTLTNRTLVRAEELASDVARSGAGLVEVVPLERHDALGDQAVWVNASSAGMVEYGEVSPLPESCLRSDLLVMDIVYKPLRTRLLDAATRAGARAIGGERMLLHQAAGQFELYTGQPAPLDALERALIPFIGTKAI
jgi:shikimate dehydrogenase